MVNELLSRQVTIIIATAGTAARKESLLSAVRSLEQQEIGKPRILVVFNGPNVSEAVVECVSALGSVDVERLAEAGLPNALNYGRRCVTTPYFGFLDDDDTYLPNALSIRCRALQERPDVDAVATNGYVDSATGRNRLLPDAIGVENEPLSELMRQNWLASCGGLFRAATVDDNYFPKYSKYFEWTVTAFLLSLDRKVVYVGEPTFIVNETTGSLSASDEYVEAYPTILRRLLTYPVDRDIRSQLRSRLTRALHAASVRSRERGDRRKAWGYHCRSLLCNGGLRYLAYTRKLIV